ncbi:peptide ABC transporter substrate-binding protein [Psychromicrobium lacuslunae]|uniref:ABC transporter substrate-binding protein n=1 Tax=Psychromicrobium lacuslunae TaxID=1618207 RepID=A0A0D4BZQ7_9MICC|nr:ABC transporter substrate-binding protein [Psychromicrobium lacuslunae]AJT41576.1 ABC transporter substrate-binding protein [Psychromicrobium lacuslunae]
MRFSRTSKAIGIAAIAALALTACGGGGGGTSSNGTDNKGNPEAIITAYGGEPQKPLMPADTNEVFGGRVVEQLFQGLRSYKADGTAENELAESIDSTDNQNWTIKIKTGTKFTNDEAVTAKSFVDAWNFAALSTSIQSNSSFFSNIEGYDAVSATEGEGDAAKPAPKAQTMTGLKVVDDSTFTVKLSAPDPDYPESLGYSAFMPLPSAAIKDPKTYGQKPVGNGPYKMGPDGWQHDKSISLVKNADYKGPREPKNGGVTFTFYTDVNSAYTDIQGDTLDVMDGVPGNYLTTYKTDLPDHNTEKASAANSTLNIPSYVPGFGNDEEGKLRRQALSLAINREEICKVIFNGTRTPAVAFVSPSLQNFDANIPGAADLLKFDAAKAQDLWAQANKIKPWDASKPLTLSYNTSGAGNKEWIDAVANQFKTNLKIAAEGKPYAQFSAMLDDRQNKKLTGLVRAGWQWDYPSIYNGLAPLYESGASSNYEQYSNPEFDKTLKEAVAAKSPDEAKKKYVDAQAILFKDLPNLPLWDQIQQAVWSTKASGVELDWRGAIVYSNIVKS